MNILPGSSLVSNLEWFMLVMSAEAEKNQLAKIYLLVC